MLRPISYKMNFVIIPKHRGENSTKNKIQTTKQYSFGSEVHDGVAKIQEFILIVPVIVLSNPWRTTGGGSRTATNVPLMGKSLILKALFFRGYFRVKSPQEFLV